MKGGENVADFERLYQEHYSFIFKYLMKLCGDRSLAEELTQEAFYRAYMNLSRLREEAKASAWLCQIAKNCYYAWYNEHKKLSDIDDAEAVGTPDIAESFVDKELSSAAFRALHALDEPYKEVFMLSVFGNLPLRKISEIFGKSESWARVTFYRARQKLMESLR